jgi:hypothetical protein
MDQCGTTSMMTLHAKFPLKTEPRPAIATGLYHVTVENLPLTLKLPLVTAAVARDQYDEKQHHYNRRYHHVGIEGRMPAHAFLFNVIAFST